MNYPPPGTRRKNPERMEADEATHDGDQAAAAGERPSDDEEEGGNDLEEEVPDMW